MEAVAVLDACPNLRSFMEESLAMAAGRRRMEIGWFKFMASYGNFADAMKKRSCTQGGTFCNSCFGEEESSSDGDSNGGMDFENAPLQSQGLYPPGTLVRSVSTPVRWNAGLFYTCSAENANSIPMAKPNPAIPKLTEEEEEAKEEEHALVVDQAGDGSDQEKAPRFPRWTRQEILVLIEGKRVEESKGRKSRVVDNGGHVNTESKWSSISSYCKRHGVSREPVQCRKRWSTLSRDYKKIRDWEARHGDQSFWLLRNDVRRETKLPGFFDRELYNILDKSIIGKQGFVKDAVRMPEPIFDSGRSAIEEGLFSDFEHSAQEEVAGSPEKEILESPSTTPPGVGPDKLPTSNGEKVSASSGAGQKRRRVSSEGDSDGDLRHQLLSILERNGRALTAHVEAHNLNCQLDRNQRSEHAESLVGVLGKLADALGRIADKLQ